MAPGRHTNGAPWPILMAHPTCAISIPDTNGAPGGAPLVKITNGVLLMAHHRCAINGHIRCAISRGFSSSVTFKHKEQLLGKTIQEGLQIIFLPKSSFQIGIFLFKLGD